MTPAAMMISGNGTAKKKMATNDAAASATSAPLPSARRPMRSTASITTASTAGLSPKNRPSMSVTSRHVT